MALCMKAAHRLPLPSAGEDVCNPNPLPELSLTGKTEVYVTIGTDPGKFLLLKLKIF
jgi:hypothetical protein